MEYDARELKAMGYPVLPVMPPDAKLGPGCKMNPDDRGKAPGRMDGEFWYLLSDWQRLRISVDLIMAWKANVGCLLGDVLALDLDVNDETMSQYVAEIAHRTLGPAPERIGRPPRRMLLYRREGPYLPHRQMRFERGGVKHLIELLSRGKQAVFAGKHRCGSNYHFPHGLVPFKDLTPISHGQLDVFNLEVDNLCRDLDLPVLSTSGGGEYTEIDQASLIGDEARLRAAMAFIPNTPETYPERWQYINIGIALKAATVGFEDVGWELYRDWAMKWPGARIEVVEKDWDGIKGKHSLGARYIYDEAKKYGYNDAAEDFEPLILGAPPEPESKDPVRYSDVWMAEKFVRDYNDRMRLVNGREREYYYTYTGRLWTPQPSAVVGLAIDLCKDVADKVLRTGTDTPKALKAATQLAHRLLSARMVTSIPNIARSNPGVVKTHEREFDLMPDLLNTPAGVMDLRTGGMVPPDPRHMISLQTAIDPEYEPPVRWLQFLQEATGGNEDLIAFLQRMVGYGLTGHVSEQVLFFFHGTGGNGKGVFLNTIAAIMGQYARTASTGVFLASEYDRHPTELASLLGARIVLAQELRQGQQWDEARIKMCTGGDTITARFMRQDEFTFVPTFKPYISGNNRPAFASVDPAMVRRFRLIPFTQTPKVVDIHLMDTLKAEQSRIFGWMLQGTRDWYERGLEPPAIVLETTKGYLDEEDTLGRWMAERCVREPGNESRAAATYDDWSVWCGTNGCRPGSLVSFGRKMRDLGFQSKRDEKGVIWLELALKPG